MPPSHVPEVKEPRGEYDRVPDRMWGSESKEGAELLPLPRDPSDPAEWWETVRDLIPSFMVGVAFYIGAME